MGGHPSQPDSDNPQRRRDQQIRSAAFKSFRDRNPMELQRLVSGTLHQHQLVDDTNQKGAMNDEKQNDLCST